MGVIGIVSALTLPNLNSSTGDKERVAKVKKIYRDLTDAYGRVEAVYGPYSDWGINHEVDKVNSNRFGERMTEFMKVSKDCKTDDASCFTSGKQKKLDGSEGGFGIDPDNSLYKIITADGMSIAFLSSGVGVAIITVDIDGPSKGSFTYGKDLFLFVLNEASDFDILPGHSPYCSRTGKFSSKLSHLDGCSAAWIIQYDNADYLQIQSVSGSTATCKNGNTITESHPRCK